MRPCVVVFKTMIKNDNEQRNENGQNAQNMNVKGFSS